MSNNRQEFSAKIKATLAKRVGFKCSNPNCNRPTSGPATEKDKSINIGVAAHIIPASVNGPRAEKVSNLKRRDITNGIWLCQTCSVLIDKDPLKFDKNILYNWKKTAEKNAEHALDSSNLDNYYFYNTIFFSTKLHAIWAAFFDEVNWHYTYEKNNDCLSPNFYLTTEGGDNYQVFIIAKRKIDLKFRQEIGRSTNYAGNILILNSNPFPNNNMYNKNIIGVSSLAGVSKSPEGEDDFEFCTSIVSSKVPVSAGTNIYNLCNLDPLFHEIITKEDAIYLNLWKKAKLIIG